jgi:hypothetical protein
LAQYRNRRRRRVVAFLQNLVLGMPARIQELIERDGGMTRY